MYKILSIDGGGIRGIIPALVLANIELKTGKKTAEMFDMIAGASTGGILALLLARPGDDNLPYYFAKEIAEIYETRGKEIFKKHIFKKLPFVDYFDEKYSHRGIEKVLTECLGDTYLSESLTELLIPAYDIERRLPFFFKKRHAVNDKAYNFRMRYIARATSAAPTYFEPFKLLDRNGDGYYPLIDGGVIANNPAMCALADAFKFAQEETSFLIVSLGTGELTRKLDYDKAINWGQLHWARNLIDIFLDGESDTTHYQIQWILQKSGNQHKYFRLQTELELASDDLDNTSDKNLQNLVFEAQKLIHQHESSIDEICNLLT